MNKKEILKCCNCGGIWFYLQPITERSTICSKCKRRVTFMSLERTNTNINTQKPGGHLPKFQILPDGRKTNQTEVVR